MIDMFSRSSVVEGEKLTLLFHCFTKLWKKRKRKRMISTGAFGCQDQESRGTSMITIKIK